MANKANKKLYPDKITRDEINEAMQCFFDKGGKIKKIEGMNQDVIGEGFDTQESFLGDEPSYLNLDLLSSYNN